MISVKSQKYTAFVFGNFQNADVINRWGIDTNMSNVDAFIGKQAKTWEWKVLIGKETIHFNSAEGRNINPS